jgi:hypothetical protein
VLGARKRDGETRWPRGASSRRSPPRRSEAGGQQEWVERNAAQARRALLDPAVRAELLALLGTDDSEQRQARRQEEARRDLASMELRWKLAEDEVWEP